MKRRKYLLGVGSLAAAGAGAMGTGAFLSQSAKRAFTVTTAHDAQAITALRGKGYFDSKHAKEYTGYDDKGHLWVDIPRLNSGSFTYFDKLFKLVANLTQNDGKHKYWIKNNYHPDFQSHKTYTPKKGKYQGQSVPRVRWFCQNGSGNEIFKIPKPDGNRESVKGHWISGGESITLGPGKQCKVGVCLITRGLPKGVLKSFRSKSFLKNVYVQAEAADH